MNTTSFRPCWILLAVLLGLGGGCTSMDSMRATMGDRMASAPPTVRTVNGDLRQVYEAARQAMQKLGYQFTGGGPAQGRLEGLSRIGGSDNFRSSRQRAIAIHLEALEGGKVEIQVRMTEIIEENFSRTGMPATEAPLRETAAHEVFLDEVERRLQAPGSK